MGLKTLESDSLSDHKNCRLGNGYYHEEGLACSSQLPGYREIEAPYLEIHNNGKQALNYASNGDRRSGTDEHGGSLMPQKPGPVRRAKL
jgi:hypothetical protein